MESLEVSAKTVEEAVDLALKRLEVDRAEVDVVVVTEGRSGILGIGSEPARVKVTPKDRTPEAVTLAKEVLEDIFDMLDVDARGPAEDQQPFRQGPLPGHSGRRFWPAHRSGWRYPGLPPVHGELRRQPQTQRMVPPSTLMWRAIASGRYTYLETLAERLAKRVRTTGKPFTLDPMPANERRIVHLALANNAQVTTESTGSGSERRLSIRPAPGSTRPPRN